MCEHCFNRLPPVILHKAEVVPPPGLPPTYPHYLKPIPINRRSAVDVLNNYLNRKVPQVARVLYSTWNAETQSIKYQEIANAITGKDPFGRIVETETQEIYDKFGKEYSRYVNEVLFDHTEDGKLIPGAANQSMVAGAEQIETGMRAARFGENFAFDPYGQAVTSWVERHGGELITRINDDQRQAIRSLIHHYTVVQPTSADDLARILRPCLGLTSGQADAVRKYREALIADGTTDPQKIEHQVQNYSARLHRIRAQRIADNELSVTFKQGQSLALDQAKSEGAFATGQLMKEWYTAEDERVCPVCGPMHGQQRPKDELYSTGTITADAHILCRCDDRYFVLRDTRNG